MAITTYLQRLWAALRGTDPTPALIEKDMKMALADDILAVFPKFQAAVAAKDAEIASLTAQVSDLQQQISDAENAVLTLSNEVAPAPAPEPAPADGSAPIA